MRSNAAAAPEAYCVDGLEHDVEVLIDRWGIPHVYAESRLDAFVAQGFQVARDRLFQIDLWRRRGLGRLSEVLGERYVDQDRAARLFLYRGDMTAEWLAYGSETREVVTAFVDGINAFVDWVLEDPDERLPPEFGSLRYRPARWRPEDVVRIRTHGLFSNAEHELARALTVRDLGREAERFRAVREPYTPLEVADENLYEGLSEDVLAVFRLAFAPVEFGTNASAEFTAPSASNNWVIAPSRTGTGRPVLANDPHRAMTVPSLRYLAHLEAPGLSIIGAGEPNLPGVSIGHNGKVAFGLTIWPVDHEDIYLYELHPDDDTRYRYGHEWEQFRIVEERADVAGAGETLHTLTYTRHGPVVWIDPTRRRVLAVRAAWLAPGMAPYLGSLAYLNAQNATEFVRALGRWGAPGVNQVFATVDGDIGWQASANVPRRRGWDGALPVPGDGQYEWHGFASVDELPSLHNPESGWVSTSNEHNLPVDYDHTTLPITTDWFTNARHERLVEWLSGPGPHDVAASYRMQDDAMNLHARVLLDALAAVPVPGPADEWAALQAWDGIESVDSFPALLFQVWQRWHLRPWLVDRCLTRLGLDPAAKPEARRRLLRADALFSDQRPDLSIVAMFDMNDDDDLASLTIGVDETLRRALADIERRLGADRSNWTWGSLHRTRLRHPVFGPEASASPAISEGQDAFPSMPRAGSGDTVGLASYDANFTAVVGSSFRMVLDVGAWDRSLVVNTPGQSGDPRSPHYADLYGLWAEGGSFPLLYTRAAVAAATSHRIVLRAGSAP